MEELTKEQFDKLWNINPTYTEQNHNYDSTFNILFQTLKYPRITPDGQLVSFDLIFKRYKLYYQVKTTLNENTDPKYIKKENKILPLFRYIFDEMFNSVEKLPMTQRHFYFWGEMDADQVKDKYKIFLQLCQK